MGIIKSIHLERYLALLAWFIGGIAGISPDTDHILSAIAKDKIPWDFLHQPPITLLFVGLAFTSLGGLVISLVLRRIK